MEPMTRRTLAQVLLGAAAAPVLGLPAHAAEKEAIDSRVTLALRTMYRQLPNTKALAPRARGMLVMPDVLKGGFLLGGAYGEGALLLNAAGRGYDGPSAGYFSVAAASLGLQVGVQTTSHVLFFMTDDALKGFRRADGWEVGADAEVTFPEAGLNLQVNSTLLEKPVIGVVFGQDGFLVGASLEGAKYSRIVR